MIESAREATPHLRVVAETTLPVAGTVAGAAPRLELARLELAMRAGGGVRFTTSPARALHGALYHALSAVDPAYGAAAHDRASAPFALSPLYQVTTGGEVPVLDRIAPGERVRLTIGALDPRAVAGLTTAMRRLWQADRPLQLDGAPLRIESCAPLTLSGPRWPPATYHQLLLAAVPAELVTLRFVSPTLFRHKEQAILQPEPRLVFGSAWRRWQEYAPGLLTPSFLDCLLGQITLVEQAVELTIFHVGHTEHRAFIGWAVYHIGGDAETRKAAAALADYAVYCGTGSRTAYGMGETRCPGGLWDGH